MQRVTSGMGDVAYVETGAGAPAMVFIHGWTSSHRTWSHQIDHFGQRHRCIAVDLPGHGDSSAPETDYTIPGFAEAVEEAIAALDVSRPVVIGHSMGGIIALEMAARQPSSYAGIVMVDPAAIVPRENVVQSMQRSYQAMAGGQLRETLAVIHEKFIFEKTDGKESRLIAGHDAAATPDHVVLSAWKGMLDWDGRATLEKAAMMDLPVLHIAANRPNNHIDDLRAVAPRLMCGQTVGAGHFNHMDAADQVNAMIEKYLEISGLSCA